MKYGRWGYMKKKKLKSAEIFEKLGLLRRLYTAALLLVSTFLISDAFSQSTAGGSGKEESSSTTTTDFDWCVLVCPKTCNPGKEFEIRIEPKNLKETTRNWEAGKLAVHLFWSGKEKWGGYLTHFASVELSKGGPIVLKGKFELNDKIRNEAAYVCVNAYLTSDWTDDKNKAADLMGPKIEIVNEKEAPAPRVDKPAVPPANSATPAKPTSKLKGSSFGEAPTEILLWENGAPGQIEGAHKAWPGVGEGGVQLISRIGIPSIILHKPLNHEKNRKVVILCPGGAYQALASVDNGNGTLDPFLKDGFVVVVLKYRTVPNPKQAEIDALADAKRAVRLVRHHAGEWGIDPKQVSVVGWSAGGNLVLNLSSNTDNGKPEDADPVERQSCRPDFVAMLCPWPTSRPAGEYPISKDSPPAFIASAKDDKAAPTKFAVEISKNYEKAGVQSNLWVIEEGGHRAFSFDSTGEGSHWRERFVEWLNKTCPGKMERVAK
ncbi:MAG TPA: hypothetical protein DET40_01155 [Lentisphaeria bacterium]|nr:MAG: hypothetical protein A2X45_00620 [Lentisphaerae bacterium GWF2_50_93]HCE42139.1 hypothetical protein [Lentisphaeria bacterium]